MRDNIKVAEPTETGQLLVLLVIISYKTCLKALSLGYELEVENHASLEYPGWRGGIETDLNLEGP